MEIVHDASELVRYMGVAMELDTRHPVLIDKYMQGKEVEVDAIADEETVFIPGIMEHIERAGVHSGDAMAVYPGLNLTKQETDTIVDYAVRIGLSLKVRGLMNIAAYALYSILCLVLNREAAQNIGRADKAVSPTFFNT